MIWEEYAIEKGKGYSKSEAEQDAELAQSEELETLSAQEQARKDAMSRKKRGRASLLTGDELGQDKLGE